jgi:Ca2+-binding EF-hand superfamily protein
VVCQAARRLDLTGTGVLSAAQFQAALAGLNFTVPPQLLARLLERYDDGRGRVDCARVARCVLREHANAYDQCHVMSQVFTPRQKPSR